MQRIAVCTETIAAGREKGLCMTPVCLPPIGPVIFKLAESKTHASSCRKTIDTFTIIHIPINLSFCYLIHNISSNLPILLSNLSFIINETVAGPTQDHPRLCLQFRNKNQRQVHHQSLAPLGTFSLTKLCLTTILANVKVSGTTTNKYPYPN